MAGGKISKLVVVITSKATGQHVERWQFDVQIFGRAHAAGGKSSKSSSKGAAKAGDKENKADGEGAE